MDTIFQKIEAQLTSHNWVESLGPLFCQTLKWGAPHDRAPRHLSVGAPVNQRVTIQPVAQLGRLPVFRVDWCEDRLPGVMARRAVQRALKPQYAEHLLCYVTRDQRQAAFTWARQRGDGKIELRTMSYQVGSPARTTIERLGELAFTLEELEHGEPSISALTDKLNRAFDVEAVTKRFYQELANWFFWARQHVEFPMPHSEKNRDAYISQSLIRLITRLIFCWFVKEMGLIRRELFDPGMLSKLLKNGDRLPESKDTTFYKAILQNLFFATLNQEIGKRQFRKRNKDPHGRDPHRGITNLYRYEDLFTDSNAFLELVKGIPFLNGGLFECLDQVYRAEENRPDLRIDGFSDHPNNPLSVPDFLFFGQERTVDLSEAYGQSKYKRATVRGLIHIFNRYNFTVIESTPLDQEVALDPELAGKVFENLLAAYNPETATTARKATGSYYTPRPIVEYMVDEALAAYLQTKVEQAFLPVADLPTKVEQAFLPVPDESQTGMSVPLSTIQKTRRNLPHWTKQGAIYWITFRLADALPQDKLREWKEQRDIWLKLHPEPWSDKDWTEYDDRFGKQLEDWLDAGMGSRALARPGVREVVRSCLMRFDGERLRIHSAVIMPTHVHALLEPLGDHRLSELLKGIKGASAREANKILGTSRQFWLDESFDHIVRNRAQYERFLHYIQENPAKAQLRPDEYWLYQNTDIVEQAFLPVPDESQTGVSVPLFQRIRHLLAYNDEPHQFTPQEVEALICAIDNLKALDPACGSGAFPMGLLHKLVFILGKLDPHNEQWKQRQIARVHDAMRAAEKIEDAVIRERTLKELEHQIAGIEDAFARGELDYGRKLYLIENCIYGVDIQPIAVQIAKMRFFISLTIDQKVQSDTSDTGIPACDSTSVPLWNLGIRPLPNLETKFVAANTLIGIEKPAQISFRNPRIDELEQELKRVREAYFTARTPQTKQRCRERDAELRAQIAELLERDGWGSETAAKLAAWDPYDQNASADFFDPEWMFGIREGFDIVIGNPPYGLVNKRQNKVESIVVTPVTLKYYKTEPLYEPARGGIINIFRLFIVKSIDLLCSSGIFSEIFPLAFTADASMSNLRKYLLQNHNIHFIEAFPERDNVAKRVFEASKMSVCIMQLERRRKLGAKFYIRLNRDRFVDVSAERAWLTAASVALLDKHNATIPLVTQRELNLLEKVYRQSIRVGDLTHCFTGEVDLTLGEEFITQDSCNPPLLRGAGIGKYCVLPKMSQGEFLYLNEGAFLRAASPQKAAHTKTHRIVLQGITGVNERIRLRMTLVPPNTYLANSVNYLIFDTSVDLRAFLAILNSSLINFVFSKFSTNSNVNGYEVDNLPLPKAMHDRNKVPERDALVKLVDKILAAKRADPAADTSAWEREIDQLVYRLYGLTEEEIKIVEQDRS